MALVFLFVCSMIALSTCGNSYPFPFPNGISPCENTTSYPPILSFHVHVVFDGTNKTTTQSALDLRAAFIMDTNPKMEWCPFSHPNSAATYTSICQFPFNISAEAFPYDTSTIFNAADYAFFVPKTELLYTDMWYRQHYDSSLMSYMIHVNTGCEDKSHTIWSMVNEGYKFKVNKTGLFCCHDGPLACYCDIVQYIYNDNSNKNQCITADYNKNSMYLSECSNNYDDTTFRETYYNNTFIQLENFGTTGGNTYMCLGQSSNDGNDICNIGKEIELIKCKQDNEAMVLFNYDNITNTISASMCDNLCVSFDPNDNLLKLADCKSSSTFTRHWFRN